tara:strand:+ start:415 stop:1005 length:591 start_codon:yes stop_codon:yes gene_type:complete
MGPEAATGGVDWMKVGGATASAIGGYMSARSAKKALAAQKAQAIRDRKMIMEAGDASADDIRRGANPLAQQALTMEQMANFRDSFIGQSLTAGLRTAAAGIARQQQAQGLGTTTRQAVAGQLMQGQGLLAKEKERTDRRAQLANLAANLRGQVAGVMGRASEARYASRVAASQIEIPQDDISALGVGLTAFGSSFA